MATIEVPDFDGYECIGFVVPADHLPCKFLDTDDELVNADGYYNGCKRLCYRKIKPNRITFEFTGDVRRPKKDEWYKTGMGGYSYCAFDGDIGADREIYRIVEE